MNELERIFSDAHLIDFNLSQWDKMLEIWLLVDHLEVYEHRKPLLKVCFYRLNSIQIKFNNIGIELDEDWQHCQWNISELISSENDGYREFCLQGDKPSPDIILRCQDVSYEKMSHSFLDRLFPGWEKPYSPLARKGIEELFVLYSGKK